VTVYAADNAAVQYIGRWTDVTGERRMSGGKTWARFRVYGKSLTLNVNAVVSGTGTMKWSIDGGTFTAYNFGSTGVQITTDLLAAGSDGWHDIVISCETALWLRLVIATAITVTADGTPDIAAHSEVWTVSKLGDTAEFTNLVSGATLGSNKRGHTWGTASTSFGHSTPSGNMSAFQDETVFFRASCTKLAIWCSGPGPYVVYRDGVVTGSPITATANNAPYQLIELLSSEDGTEHEYRIIKVGNLSNNSYLDAVCILGTFSGTAPTLGDRIAFLGDSTTANHSTTLNSAQGFVCKLIGELGMVGFNRGVAGNTSAQMNTRLAADVLAIASLYAVVVTSGANDGAVADATLQATCETIYNAILADDAATLCHVCEAWGTSGGNREGAVNLAAVTAVANARCIYHDTDNWIIHATDTHDGVHPNDTGGTKIKVKLMEFLIVLYGFRNLTLLGVG